MRLITGIALALLMSIGTADRAEAAQHQNAYYYSHWNFAGATAGYWNVDQQMKVEQKANASYWALVWKWSRDPQHGGYLGLQTDGNRSDGSVGDTAIFSLWNANAANGPACGTFGGEGVGYSCRLAFPIKTDAYYRLRVWRLDADSHGQWWGAWIQDLNTGVDSYVGSIRVASLFTTMTAVENFAEYYGPAVACSSVPMSKVLWTQPAANSRGGGRYQYGSSYAATSSDKGNCTGGGATPVDLGHTRGVRVVLGG